MSELGKRLHKLADEQNDARDHDELHAAGAVAHLHGRNKYVTRWIDGLLAANGVEREQ